MASLLIELISRHDATGFKQFLENLEDVSRKAQVIGESIKGISSPRIAANPEMRRLTEQYLNASLAARELAEEVRKLNDAQLGKIQLDDRQIAESERRIRELAGTLKQVVRQTEAVPGDGLTRWLHEVAGVKIGEVPEAIEKIKATIKDIPATNPLEGHFARLLEDANALLTYLNRIGDGNIAPDILQGLMHNLRETQLDAIDAAGSMELLQREIAELNNGRTSPLLGRALYVIDDAPFKDLDQRLGDINDKTAQFGNLLRNGGEELAFVRNNTKAIRTDSQELGNTYAAVNKDIKELRGSTQLLANELATALNPATAGDLHAAYQRVVDLLSRRRESQLNLIGPEGVALANQTVDAYRDLALVINQLGAKQAAAILGLTENDVANLRAAGTALQNARAEAQGLGPAVQEAANDLLRLEHIRETTTRTARTLVLPGNSLIQQEIQRAQKLISVNQTLEEQTERIFGSTGPRTGRVLQQAQELAEQTGKVETKAKDATTAIAEMETRLAGVAEEAGDVAQRAGVMQQAFDDGLDELGTVQTEMAAVGTAAQQAADRAVTASRKTEAQLRQERAAITERNDEWLRGLPPMPEEPSDGNGTPPRKVESLEEQVRKQLELITLVHAEGMAQDAVTRAYMDKTQQLKAAAAAYKDSDQENFDVLMRAEQAWQRVIEAAKQYGMAVQQTAAVTELVSEPFAEIVSGIEKARQAARDFGDTSKIATGNLEETVNVAKELEAIEKRRKSIAGKFDNDQENMQRLAVQARILQDAIDAGKDSTGELKKAFDNTLVAIAKASTKAEELRGQILGLVAGLQINGQGLSQRLFDIAHAQEFYELLGKIDQKAGQALTEKGIQGGVWPMLQGATGNATATETGESLQRLAANIKLASTEATNAASDLQKYDAALAETRGSVDKFLTTNQGAEKALEDIGRAVQAQVRLIGSSQRTWDLLATALNEYAIAIDRVAGQKDPISAQDAARLADMREEIDRLVLEMDTLHSASRKLEGINIAEAITKGNAIEKAEKDMKKLATAEEQAALRAHGLQKQLEKTGSALSKMLFGGDLKTTFITGAFLSLGREVENIFQSWFQNVQEWINTSNQQFDAYRQSITQTFAMIPSVSAMARDAMIHDVMAVGTEYGYLTEQTLPALQKALQLGVAQADLGDTLEASARAARVTGGDYVQMLASGQNIINAYGGKLKDLNEVYELLYFAQRNAGVGADSLTQHLAPIIAVTGDLGVSLEDVIAAVVTMVKQGDDLESVSSLLSNMFTQIQISGTALGGVFEEAAKTDFRTFIANGGTLLDAMRLIEEQAKKTGTSIPSLVGGDSNFYRDQQAMIAVLELTNQHLGELAAISSEVRAGQELIAEGYQGIADEAFMSSQRTAAHIEQMNLQAAESWQPVRKAWADLKAETAAGIGGAFDLSNANREWREFTQTLLATAKTYEEYGNIAAKTGVVAEALKLGADEDAWWDGDSLKTGKMLWAELNQEWTTAEQRTKQLAYAQKLIEENTDAANREIVNASYAILHVMDAVEANQAPTEQMMADLKALQEQFPATYREVRTFLAELGLAPPLLNQTGQSVLFLGSELEKLGLKGQTAFYNIPITDEAVLERMRYGIKEIGRVLDGDTMQALFHGGEKPITIRLPDIDTPEIAKMIDGKLQGENQAYGQRARVFTERWMVEVEDITVSAEKGQDDFQRSLRDVKGEIDGEIHSLQDDLISAGLAIPLDLQINLTKGAKERFQQQMQLAMDAARQGVGMFENDLARAMFLEGSIDSTPEVAAIIEAQANYFPQGIQWAQQMTEAQEQLNDATGEYVTTYRDNSSEIAQIQAKLNADLSDDQKKALNDELDALDKYSERAIQIAQQLAADLSDNERAELIGKLGDLQGTHGRQMTSYTGDIEAAEEAGKKILEIQQQVEDDLKQHAWDSVFNFEGLTDQTAGLAVALGLLTQEEADFALSYAQRKTALEQLPAAFAQVTLSAQQEADAIKLIIDGSVTTAEEAIRRVQVLALNNAAPREEDAFYTDRYWKMAQPPEIGEQAEEMTYIYYTPVIAADAQTAFDEQLTAYGQETRYLWFSPADNPEKTRYGYRNELAGFFNTNPVSALIDGDAQQARDEQANIQHWYDQHPVTVKIIGEYNTPDTNGPGAEGGGHVTAGRAYIVGEQGEELFIPYTNGRIVPNHQIHEARGETTINVAIDARGNANYNQIGRSARQGVLSAAKRMGIPIR
jgi:endonuclease YncB( thermonuclease family)/predicted RNase H-related nuclease YkuK (DUF458 family)